MKLKMMMKVSSEEVSSNRTKYVIRMWIVMMKSQAIGIVKMLTLFMMKLTASR